VHKSLCKAFEDYLIGQWLTYAQYSYTTRSPLGHENTTENMKDRYRQQKRLFVYTAVLCYHTVNGWRRFIRSNRQSSSTAATAPLQLTSNGQITPHFTQRYSFGYAVYLASQKDTKHLSISSPNTERF